MLVVRYLIRTCLRLELGEYVESCVEVSLRWMWLSTRVRPFDASDLGLGRDPLMGSAEEIDNVPPHPTAEPQPTPLPGIDETRRGKPRWGAAPKPGGGCGSTNGTPGSPIWPASRGYSGNARAAPVPR
jgi:hypothetical protein